MVARLASNSRFLRSSVRSPRLTAAFYALVLILAPFAWLEGLSAAASERAVLPSEPISQAMRQGVASTASTFLNLPVSFVPNAGQFDRRVAYAGRGSGYDIYLTPHEAVFVIVDEVANRGDTQNPERPVADPPASGFALALRFLDADPSVRIEGRRPSPGTVNYQLGNDSTRWHTGLPTYWEVAYRNLWPGVDLVFRGEQARLGYEFRLAPGADTSSIRLAYRGSEGISTDNDGNLAIATQLGTITNEHPLALQIDESRSTIVPSGFSLNPDPQEKTTYGLQVGSRDSGLPLTIDSGLAYSTFLGGPDDDLGLDLAVDASGSAYVAGRTASSGFPTTAGAFDTSQNGGADAFVSKLNPAGTGLIYSTFLGGSEFDDAQSITVDSSGAAYLTGLTLSSDFPTTLGAFDTTYNGGDEAYVTKLGPTGGMAVYSTFLGGSGNDIGLGVAVDALGSAYVTGVASSGFPTTTGAFDPTHNGGDDAFATKLDPAGASVLYSTFLGGSGFDQGAGIAVGVSNDAYIGGSTSSSGFPTTPGAYDRTHEGGLDGFVASIAPGGAALVYSSFVGGSDMDRLFSVATDGSGAAYVTGFTRSLDFPATPGAFDTSHNGGDDAFVTKFLPAGTALAYSSFLGGAGFDQGRGLAVDGSGNSYITGVASSGFPTTSGAFDTVHNGGNDVFVSKVNPSAATLAYSSFLGGSRSDVGQSIVTDPSGAAWVTGFTNSSDFPTSSDGFDSTYNGNNDAFVAKLETTGSPVATVRIDIKPRSFPNAINLQNRGTIPVAVLSESDFDATKIVTACFGDAEGPAERDCSETHFGQIMAFHAEDVDGDGLLDALFHFETQETGIDEHDTEACVHGTAFSGTVAFEGCDAIMMV